ncbi:NAD(P)-dependent alcohol dehydrogenase [Chloroflexota bacterium]
MKAIVWKEYGPPEVLQLAEVDKPAPKDNEVLIKIYAATATAGDCEQRGLNLPFYYRLPMRLYVGIKKPKRITVLGMDLAGEIEAAGKDVTLYNVGDQVFAATGLHFGAYAQYTCLPAEPEDGALALKPTNMSYEEAAAVPTGGIEALHYMRKANIESGQQVLISGAGGTIGPYAVQLAKYYGAEVTAVDSADKLDMLSSIGADHFIDYARQDFTKSSVTYDVIFDVVGKASYSGCVRSLKPKGRYFIANPGLSHKFRGIWTSVTSSKKVASGPASYKTDDLIFLGELIESGKLKSVIDRTYPLEEIVEAHKYVETGQKAGNVVITVSHE